MDRASQKHATAARSSKANDWDADVAWCLTCSKKTRDASSPYCSDECRLQDIQPSSSPTAVETETITVAIPQLLARSPSPPLSRSTTRALRSPSRGKSNRPPRSTSRPPLATLPAPTQHPMHTTTDATQPIATSSNHGVPRDRRAFSFPAVPDAPRVSMKRVQRQSQAALPPFIRKSNLVSGGVSNSPSHTPANKSTRDSSATGTPNSRQKAPKGKGKQTNSTGGNTPLFPESVFGSTSESDEEREEAKQFVLSPFAQRQSVDNAKSLPLTPRSEKTSKSLLTDPAHNKMSSHRKDKGADQDTLRLPRRDTVHRKPSQSPVAAFVASSASSRSREDIISWAKAVGVRPGATTSSDDEIEDEERGRSRTRRSPRAKPLTKKLPSPQETAEVEEQDDVDVSRAGTTPKSSIGSALAGLSIGGFGVGPIVKALSNMTTPNTPAPVAVRRLSAATTSRTSGALGLQAVPSRAEVSKVAVVTTSLQQSTPAPPSSSSATNPTDSDAPPQFGGATPTLSTISISELMDPTGMSDNHEHVEVITDLTDDAMSTASFARQPPSTASRPSISARPSGKTKGLGSKSVDSGSTGGTAQAEGHIATNAGGYRANPPPWGNKRPPLPLRPIASTASAIWNLSTYLRSITPFSIASAIAPYGPFSPTEEVQAVPSPTLPPVQPLPNANSSASTAAGIASVAPVPTSRVASPDPTETSPKQIVRSLPMDIALPLRPDALAANQERMREREAREWLNRSNSRSRRRTRSRRSRSRSRSRSQRRSRSRCDSISRSRSDVDRDVPPKLGVVVKGQVDTGVFEDEEDDDDARRGRGRQSRQISYDADESGVEDGPRRGRSRKGKALGPPGTEPVSTA